MSALFSFAGRMRRLPYASAALAVLLAQYLALVAAFHAVGWPVPLDWRFVVVPLRTAVLLNFGYGRYDAVELLLFVFMLAVAWVQAALAFRRAADAGLSGWLAVPTVAPVLQLPAVVILALLPSRTAPPLPPEEAAAEAAWPAAAQGVLAGIGLSLFAVAAGALVFGTYGYGMFVVSPFVIGAATGYLANRRGDIGGGPTARLVFVATTLGGIALIIAALEGALCLVLASPLGLVVALIGGVFGRAVALRTRGSAANALVGLALLPMVFASEQAWPGGATFETQETIEVAAPPQAVWRALVDMDEIAAPPALPFRLGVAYPRRGVVVGEGVGATRIGVFSTGVAHERVTAWQPGRLLAFAVLSEPPAMREFSPYEHVHSPHVEGYFRTLTTSFALEPLGEGRTRIVEHTEHALQLDPLIYWLPMARWIIHLNNTRVLTHIRDQAEGAAAAR
jgi:uncharacterized membrane protein YhaH (DUF805 family)